MGKALVIKGADFAANAISEEVIIDDGVYGLVNKISIGAGFYLMNLKSRANVLITRESATTPTPWISSGANINTTLQPIYSMICIPADASTCTIKMTNTSYYFGLTLRTAHEILYDSGWTQGGNTITVKLTDYPTALYVASTLKIGSAGSTEFTDETLESVGWSIEWH